MVRYEMYYNNKMANDILKSCRKYVIQRIVNPGVYWMATCHSSAHFEKEMKKLDFLLSKNVEKIASSVKISIGKIIAVQTEIGYHRGSVIDIFNRSGVISYLILLVDYGHIIETSGENIYWIKNKELINKKYGATEVSVKGIQPVALDLECDKHFMGGIFQKRAQDNWSVCAYKFVEDLFEKNPCVFVRPVNIDSRSILGEIYFIQEHNNIMSLSQTLCDKGFAVFQKSELKIAKKINVLGNEGFDIEEKIPKSALSADLQNRSILKTTDQSNKGKDGTKCITLSCSLNFPTTYHQQSKRPTISKPQNVAGSFSLSLIKKKNSISHTLLSVNSNTNYSCFLKKQFFNTLPYSQSSGIFKNQNISIAEETLSDVVLNYSKISIFKVIKKSMELYENQKQNSMTHSNN